MGLFKNFFKLFNANNKSGKETKIRYVLEGELKTIEDIQKGFKDFKLDKYFAGIQPLIRDKIGLTLEPDNESNLIIGQSKIGGRPDLLDIKNWPKTEEGKSMSFIAQLNCNELSDFDNSGLLPDEGLISFFYCADQEAWGFDPKDKQRFKVLYINNLKGLKRTEFPIDLESHSIFKPNKIEIYKSLSLPGWENDLVKNLIEDDDFDNYWELSSGIENQILGYANCVQNAMELECQLVTNGLYCGDPTGYRDPKRELLEKGADDWILLLQIGSEEEKTDMMWGDVGKLYYWIKKDDLKSKNFDKAWFIVQCY